MTSLVSTAQQQDALPEAGVPEPYRLRPDGTVEIAELWRILRHRRLLILSVAGLMTLATLFYGLLTPALFTASTQILIDPRDRIVVSNDVNPNTVSPDGGIAQVESQASVIQSTGVLMRAIRAIDLTKDGEFNSQGFLRSFLGLLPSAQPSTGIGLNPAEARALDTLRRKLSVRRADKVLVVDVVVTTQESEKSARIANAIAEAYLADQAEARSQGVRDASAGLTARLAEQRKRVEVAENAVERYRAENNLVAASGRLISEQQLTEISNQVSAAQARSATLKAQVEQISQQRRTDGNLAGSSSEAMQSAVIAKLREQEATLIQREAELQSQLGPRHPSIAAARSQVVQVRQLIATEIQRVEQSARADYARALNNEKQLVAKLDALTKQTQGSDQASVRLRDLQRDLEAVRAVYATFLLRAQETREQANLDTTNARIISQAQAPAQKSWPPLGLLIVGAMGLGLGLGAGLALIREYISPTLLSVRQAESAIGSPVIGVLPAEKRRSRLRRSVNDPQEPPPRDMAAESVAGLALMRLFQPADGKNGAARSMLLVSTAADANERQRIALLLADAATNRGERVLLIDADVEQTQENGVAGLLDVLRGECGFEAAIHFSKSQDVALMSTGRPKAMPAKPNGRLFATRMLAEASRHFETVVMDGGVLTQNIKIAPLVGTVEHIVLVAELERSSQAEIAKIVQATHIMGRRITGTILVDPAGRA